MGSNRYEIDMCNGPLFSKLVVFALPVVLSGVLQLLFNMVDIIVVGRFAGSAAMAAVGATATLISVSTTLFIGVSMGANVIAARSFALGDKKSMHEIVHTAVLTGLLSGVLIFCLGMVFISPVLKVMGTPADIIDQSAIYMKLYFMGMPFFMVYNFGAAILRAIGDTRRPLYYLIIAGVSNIGLNLFLVIVFHLGVIGVALGTVLSQMISSILVTITLCKSEGSYKLYLSKLHINGGMLLKTLQVGIPAGMQSMLICASNALIQSSINSFGTLVIAGNTASMNIMNCMFFAANGITQTGLSFTSQNAGVGNYKRILKILGECAALECLVEIPLGLLAYIFGENILGIFTTDPRVIAYGMINVSITTVPYFLCGIMDMVPGCIRGMRVSVPPMLISVTGVVGLRVLWIFFLFPKYHTLQMIYWSYPASWVITSSAQLVCFFFVWNKKKETLT